MVEAREIFKAESLNLQEVLGATGTGYYVPAYQRNYAWEQSKVGELLSDLMLGFDELAHSDEVFSFLGTVIFVHDQNYSTMEPVEKNDVPNQVLNVIDGQQRLSTLIALCVALHCEIAKRRKTLCAKPATNDAEHWLSSKSEDVLGELDDCIRFEKVTNYGKTYPRMIRAFDDQWLRSKGEYNSPIASLVAQYYSYVDADLKSAFKPTPKDPKDLFERFTGIQKYLNSVAKGEVKRDNGTCGPCIESIASSAILQKALVKFELTDEQKRIFDVDGSGGRKDLAVLVLYAQYVLKRVAITTVKGKNEDYAFEVFESLNTTGEPLTAFETFKPRVVRAVELKKYGKSAEKDCVDRVDTWLARHKVKDRPKLTADLVSQFELAESGTKSSLKLSLQRQYLQATFDAAIAANSRLAFLEHFRDLAAFQDKAWEPSKGALPQFEDVVGSPSQHLLYCFDVLRAMKHTIAAVPILRYYSEARGSGGNLGEISEVTKAIVAFSILWRASTGGTENIDAAYRAVMAGTVRDGAVLFRGLAFSKDKPVPTAHELKAELVRRLWEKVTDLKQDWPSSWSPRRVLDDEVFSTWLSRAVAVEIYKHPTVVKALLLAAYEDSVQDSKPGLIKRGAKYDPRLSPTEFDKAQGWSIEHIAPQKRPDSEHWEALIYESPSTIHTLGNLVLLPMPTNSMLTNRPWESKAVLYRALGLNNIDGAKQMLDDSGLTFTQKSTEIASKTSHVPELSAIGDVAASGSVWSLDIIKARSNRLLELAWEKYTEWLV